MRRSRSLGEAPPRLAGSGAHVCRPRDLGHERPLRVRVGPGRRPGVDRRDPACRRERRELDRYRGRLRLRACRGGGGPGLVGSFATTCAPSRSARSASRAYGSMVMAPNIGEDFVGWNPPTGGDRALGMVDFSMFPHLDHENMPDNSMANAEKWAAGLPVPGYAIDDQTAIQVTDGTVEVVSEGHWKLFTP